MSTPPPPPPRGDGGPAFTGSGSQPDHGSSAYRSPDPMPTDYQSANYNSSPGGSGTPGLNTMAVAALIVGVLSLLLCWIPLLNVVSIVGGIVGVVLGAIALRRVVPGVVGGKGLAITGIVLSVLSIIVAGLVLALTSAFINWSERTIEENSTAAAHVSVVQVSAVAEPV